MEEFKKKKWARNFSCCVICKTEKVKHKGNGFCSQCYDRKRKTKTKRIFQKFLAGVRKNFRKRFLKILENKGRKEIKCFFKKGEERRIRRNEVMRFNRYKKRGENLKAEGKNVLQIIKNGQIIYLPILVENFEKPKLNVQNIKDKKERKLKIEKYEKDLKIFRWYLKVLDFAKNFKVLEEIKNENKYKK